METTSFTAMNTYMTVKAYGENSKLLAATNYLIQQEVEWLELTLSTTIEGSDIYKLNDSTLNDNSSIIENSLHSETAYLITRSHELYEQTSGAFNPALYPVIKEWGFTTGDYKVPSEEKIQQLLKYTDFSKITIFEKASSPELLPADYDIADPAPLVIIDRPAGMQLDFGAIGKG
jgi:thiamine biosynthesis lipoprotein